MRGEKGHGRTGEVGPPPGWRNPLVDIPWLNDRPPTSPWFALWDGNMYWVNRNGIHHPAPASPSEGRPWNSRDGPLPCPPVPPCPILVPGSTYTVRAAAASSSVAAADVTGARATDESQSKKHICSDMIGEEEEQTKDASARMMEYHAEASSSERAQSSGDALLGQLERLSDVQNSVNIVSSSSSPSTLTYTATDNSVSNLVVFVTGQRTEHASETSSLADSCFQLSSLGESSVSNIYSSYDSMPSTGTSAHYPENWWVPGTIRFTPGWGVQGPPPGDPPPIDQ